MSNLFAEYTKAVEQLTQLKIKQLQECNQLFGDYFFTDTALLLAIQGVNESFERQMKDLKEMLALQISSNNKSS